MQNFALGTFLNCSLEEHKKHAEEKTIEFTPVTDFVFDITLKADVKKLKLLLSSVIKSTIDYSGASSIIFSVRELLRSEKEILLEVSLEDDGPVSQSQNRFSYLRSLVTGRNLIEELNGKSEFITSHNNGNMLKFIISCELVEENNAFNSGLKLLNGKKILVIDDNETNRKNLAEVLEQAGFECTTVANGIRAIELLEQNNQFDLILLDIIMPQMDGFETAAYIRRQLKNYTPIIALPARNKSWIPIACKEAGIDNTINKPFAPARLLRAINNILDPLSDENTTLLKTA